MFKKQALKLIIGSCIICIIAVLFLAYFFSVPRSVEYFYTLRIGGDTPYRIQTEVKDFDGSTIFVGSKFYVYLVQKDIGWCVVGNCGMSGALVECMGGWFAGEVVVPSDERFGLTKEEVDTGKSIVVVADKDQKIVGIYPNYTIKNIPYILKNHRNLSDKFDFCYDTHMPKRWGK
ncbi:MAG: hypothetical protein CEN91_398 [Candidatus Berkelbacteria bacterium Licking1014_85]|uniref:Uncharacterized protein n=1 Tax=Candidatus Berkelbacteria bacterium Licking1014_85 TaxID=2017148 RepID=A0A554LIC6_9BACT|nr:MAG: hypothetical protein CEN91_398 [Candidatus Berkelbacteria bacterium Licking1014_85]